MKVLVDKKLLEEALNALEISQRNIYASPQSMRDIYETAIKLKHVIFNTPTFYIEKPISPEGNITGEQRRITMEDGDYIVEWDGYEWKKKYGIHTVIDKEWTSNEIKIELENITKSVNALKTGLTK